jgi:pyrroloquinoline quinone (PQQ) biosynthesis protein C
VTRKAASAAAKSATIKKIAAPRASAATADVIRRLDGEVDAFVRRCRYFQEPITEGRARMFCLQHRLNTRQRNSVLKLKVATNIPDWDLKLNVIGACAQEIIADHEHGGGRAHWQILEELGLRVGLTRPRMQAQKPLVSTRLCWLAWEALMSNRHWLEGLVANTCAERANIPGYGEGILKKHGWFGLERHRWGKLFKLSEAELEFFELHEEADIEHSDLGWNAVAEHAVRLGVGDGVVEACRVNLHVWEQYLNGIGAGGDALDRGETPATA